MNNNNIVLEYALYFYNVKNYRQLSMKSGLASETISRIRKGDRDVPKKWLEKFLQDTGMTVHEMANSGNTLTECIKETNIDLGLQIKEE